MSITGRKVAVLVDDFFEQAEYEEPIDALREAGAEVEVVAWHVQPGDTVAEDQVLADAGGGQGGAEDQAIQLGDLYCVANASGLFTPFVLDIRRRFF